MTHYDHANQEVGINVATAIGPIEIDQLITIHLRTLQYRLFKIYY